MGEASLSEEALTSARAQSATDAHESNEVGVALHSAGRHAESETLFARAIARDLGAFVSSFERPPADVVDRWLRRFDEKYARDPSYFLKA